MIYNTLMSEHKENMISVIIPVYKDPDGIHDTLESLVDQDYGGEYEILPVVTVDGDIYKDKTFKVIQKFEEEYERVTCLEENKDRTCYAARNKGIEEASGDIFCFVDADMIVPNDYLSLVAEKIEDSCYFGCDVEVFTDNQSLAAKYSQMTGYSIEEEVKEGKFAQTCCLVVRKEVVEDVGLFDHRMICAADGVFGNQVYNSGYNIDFEENITLKHPARTTILELMEKHIRLGRGATQMKFYHSELDRSRKIYDPRNFLPPKPGYFIKKCRDHEFNDKGLQLQLYTLAVLMKYCILYGRLKEKFKLLVNKAS